MTNCWCVQNNSFTKWNLWNNHREFFPPSPLWFKEAVTGKAAPIGTETGSQQWPKRAAARRWSPSGIKSWSGWEACISWYKGLPCSRQRGGPAEASAGGRSARGGWKHLQPECGNRLLNLSEAGGRHGNSGGPWLVSSDPAVPGEGPRGLWDGTHSADRKRETGAKQHRTCTKLPVGACLM